MMLKPDNWLSEILDRNCFNLIGSVDNISKKDIPLGKTFIGAKKDVWNVREISALQELGFKVVDTTITLETESSIKEKKFNLTVRHARESDCTSVVKLAGSELIHNRFFRDEQINNQVAIKVKENWALNYFKGVRGDIMLIAEAPDNQVAGFALYLKRDNDLVIDLIATDPAWRRRGVGRALLRAGMASFSGEFKRVLVGTQVSNLRSLTFYYNLGFFPVAAAVSLHFHNCEPNHENF